jgi:hypothetical protein
MKIYVNVVGFGNVDYIQLVSFMDYWWAFLNTAMNLPVP